MAESEKIPGQRFPSDWLIFIITFIAFSVFFIALSPYEFLEGDDASLALGSLTRHLGFNPRNFPVHGYYTRSGTVLLMNLLLPLLKSPRVCFCALSAISAGLIVATLLLYSNLLLLTRAKFSHLLVIVPIIPEVIYAGLLPNAAVIGYALAFLAVFLGLRFLENKSSFAWFVLSGALFGFSLAACTSSAVIAPAFPLQHLLKKGAKTWKDTFWKFSVEAAAGVAVFIAALAIMGLPPWAPLQEFSDVRIKYHFNLLYWVLTLLGAIHPLMLLVLPAGLIAMLRKKMWLPLSIGMATSLLCLAIFGKLLKSFQHSLAIYLLICVAAVLVWEAIERRWLKTIYALLALVWLFFGFRLYLPEQPHRGPGFSETDTGQALTWEKRDEQGVGGFKIWQSPEINLRGRGIRLTLGSGFMLPSVDGGRALGGHFWAWTRDWKPYLDGINQPISIILSSGEKHIFMGQYATGMILFYDLLESGYSVYYNSPVYFEKNGRLLIMHNYFEQLNLQTDRTVLDFDDPANQAKSGIFISFPSFAYKLEKGTMSIKGFEIKQSLGYDCFKIKALDR